MKNSRRKEDTLSDIDSILKRIDKFSTSPTIPFTRQDVVDLFKLLNDLGYDGQMPKTKALRLWFDNFVNRNSSKFKGNDKEEFFTRLKDWLQGKWGEFWVKLPDYFKGYDQDEESFWKQIRPLKGLSSRDLQVLYDTIINQNENILESLVEASSYVDAAEYADTYRGRLADITIYKVGDKFTTNYGTTHVTGDTVEEVKDKLEDLMDKDLKKSQGYLEDLHEDDVLGNRKKAILEEIKSFQDLTEEAEEDEEEYKNPNVVNSAPITMF